ncbi:MAG: hypothetical protein RL213_2251 [Bacteroidota bacterium]|jgi:hypothetical protein
MARFLDTMPTTMKKSAFYLAVVLILSSFVQDPFEALTASIRAGNAHQISEFFGATVDLNLLEKEDVYGKGQAEVMLRDFFTKNPPREFKLLHQGKSPEGTKFGIGSLSSSNGKNFRVSFYLKSVDGKQVIKEFWVEAD